MSLPRCKVDLTTDLGRQMAVLVAGALGAMGKSFDTVSITEDGAIKICESSDEFISWGGPLQAALCYKTFPGIAEQTLHEKAAIEFIFPGIGINCDFRFGPGGPAWEWIDAKGSIFRYPGPNYGDALQKLYFDLAKHWGVRDLLGTQEKREKDFVDDFEARASELEEELRA